MLRIAKRRRKLDKSHFLLALIAVIIAATIVFIFLQLRTDLVTESVKGGKPLAVLFILDSDRPNRFFEIFLYHPGTRKGAIAYIPGNLGLIIESLKRVDRIDAIYKPEDPQALKKKVEQVTGLNIPFVIDLSGQEIADLVDLLGGLELFIPNPVELETEDRKILLPSGSVVLDGDKVRDFISYQEPLEPEMDPVGRKQKFLQALLKRLGESSDFLHSRKPWRQFLRILRSTMSDRALSTFVHEMKRLEVERMIFQRVLGSKRMVDNQELIFPHFEGDLLRETLQQTQETIARVEIAEKEQLTIAVEILNGTKTTGLARRAANVLQSFGFEVLAVGNADQTDYQTTVILDRKGRAEAARKVAELIRCNRIHSRPEEGMDPAIDVTLVLGADFDGRYCKE